MTTTTLKKNLIKRIEKLSKKKLEKIDIIMNSIEDGDEKATIELLEIPGLIQQLKKAEKSYGRGEFVRWKDIKKDV